MNDMGGGSLVNDDVINDDDLNEDELNATINLSLGGNVNESTVQDTVMNDAEMEDTENVNTEQRMVLYNPEDGNSGENAATDDPEPTEGFKVFPLNTGLTEKAAFTLYRWDVLGSVISQSVGERVVEKKDESKAKGESNVKFEVEQEKTVLKYGRKKAIAKKTSKTTPVKPKVSTSACSEIPTPVSNISTPVSTMSAPAGISTTVGIPATTTVNTQITTTINTQSTTVTSTPVTQSTTAVTTSTPARVLEVPFTIREPTSPPKPKSNLPEIDPKDKGKGILHEKPKVKKVVENIDLDEQRRVQEEIDERKLRIEVESKNREDPYVDVILNDSSVVTLSQRAVKMINDMAAQGRGL